MHMRATGNTQKYLAQVILPVSKTRIKELAFSNCFSSRNFLCHFCFFKAPLFLLMEYSTISKSAFVNI